jgi:Ion channel
VAQFIAAIYWATTTVTTIGYGETLESAFRCCIEPAVIDSVGTALKAAVRIPAVCGSMPKQQARLTVSLQWRFRFDR